MTQNRYYHLPISQSKSLRHMGKMLGHTLPKDKSLYDVDRALKKAISGKYHGISLPPNSYKHPHFENIFQKILKSPLKEIKLHIELQKFFKKKEFFLNFSKDTRVRFTFVLNHLCQSPYINEVKADKFRSQFREACHVYYYRDLQHYEMALALAREIGVSKLHIYIPEETTLSTYESYEILKAPKKLGVKIAPPQVDIFSSQTPWELEMESLAEPLLTTSTHKRHILASVIIPTFNNSHHLLHTLTHLKKQELSKENFEVIIVDDGSDDLHKKAIQTHIQSLSPTFMNIKYIYFPRVKPRSRGDHQFRAGPARNLGVKFSESEKILFLDSDIITPPTYIRTSLSLLDNYDVVQHPRYALKSFNSVDSLLETTSGSGTNQEANQALSPFWKDFYLNGENWNNIENKWKFISTHTLCLSKKNFIELGLFRKSFTQYGFEDTDLGFRLCQRETRLCLSKLPTHHITPHWGESEFLNSTRLRMLLLKRAARLFFKNNLSPSIPQALSGFAFDYFNPK